MPGLGELIQEHATDQVAALYVGGVAFLTVVSTPFVVRSYKQAGREMQRRRAEAVEVLEASEAQISDQVSE